MASEDASPDPAGLAPPASGGPLADQPSSGSVETGLSVDSSAASANESESTPDDTDTPPIAMPDNTIQQTTSSRQPLSRFSSAASGTGDAVGEKDDPAVAAKKQQIRDACVQGDFWQLQRLAGSDGGFLTDELRQLACASSPFCNPLEDLSLLTRCSRARPAGHPRRQRRPDRRQGGRGSRGHLA